MGITDFLTKCTYFFLAFFISRYQSPHVWFENLLRKEPSYVLSNPNKKRYFLLQNHQNNNKLWSQITNLNSKLEWGEKNFDKSYRWGAKYSSQKIVFFFISVQQFFINTRLPGSFVCSVPFSSFPVSSKSHQNIFIKKILHRPPNNGTC